MKLYHVSFEAIEHFEPRVPKNRTKGEDDSVPRICFTESIKKAITAMPQGGQALRGMLLAREYFTPIMHIYSCYSENNVEIFLPPETVGEKYGVYDAPYTKEWWALQTPELAHQIIIVDSAETKDQTDKNGESVANVTALQFHVVTHLPKDAPERLFAAIEIPVRSIFREIDKHTEQYLKHMEKA